MISIHAPHAGRDKIHPTQKPVNVLFQSTRPMRGATFGITLAELDGDISIHAPHAGRDGGKSYTVAEIAEFQSTRPMRGATPPLLPAW